MFFIENKRVLSSLGIDFAIFEPTVTGLKKSIIDATKIVRTLFELNDFHYYCEQGQGSECKVNVCSKLLMCNGHYDSNLSLYRPKTKNGDPRMWFSNLRSFADAGDKIAIVFKDCIPHLINLSKSDLQFSIEENDDLGQFLLCLSNNISLVAVELLNKLKEIAKKGWLLSQRTGDTGVGYTIEKELGKEPDSSKKPDYKGIELKSSRDEKNRTTLFAQVADWSISSCCNSSADILDRYGYNRDIDFKLYCTISSKKVNSQGLTFNYNEGDDQLEEWFEDESGKVELVAVWPGKLLRKRLLEKHAETFWIEVESRRDSELELFKLVSVTHTRAPLAGQLMPLISEGVITMDHLIKRNGKNNKVSEKGPLFKISKKNLSLLFPDPKKYTLE